MSNIEEPPVAVIGLGRIGAGIAASLLRAGRTVRVHNRTALKAAPLEAAGALVASSPAEAVSGAAIVVTSLLDDASLISVLEAGDGLLAGMSAGAVHVSTSTCSPGCSDDMAARHAAAGQGFVAAPVLGRPQMALAGALVSLVSGAPETLERARPVIEDYSARVVHVGPVPGTASSLKLANNFYIAALAELFGEFLAFTDKSGIDHGIALELLRGLQGHPGLAGYLERIGARDFDEVGFEMATGLKDLRLVLDAAAAVRCPLPFAGVVGDRTLSALATDLGRKDWAAFTEITRRNAGLA